MNDLVADPTLGWVVVAAVLVGAFAQGVTGMGFSLVAAPVLVAVLGHAEGVATVLVLAAGSSVIPLAREGRHAQVRPVAGLLAVTLLATPLVALVLRDVDADLLALAGGAGVVLGVVLLATGLRSARLRRPEGVVATGLGSAALNVVGGVGGPPVGLWVANADWDPARTRGTLHVFLIVQNLATALVVGWVTPAWPLLAALVVGSLAGITVAPRMSVGAARGGILLVSALGGVALVVGSA